PLHQSAPPVKRKRSMIALFTYVPGGAQPVRATGLRAGRGHASCVEVIRGKVVEAMDMGQGESSRFKVGGAVRVGVPAGVAEDEAAEEDDSTVEQGEEEEEEEAGYCYMLPGDDEGDDDDHDNDDDDDDDKDNDDDP
ncbi:MAG: hypothetical protein Q9207_008578, partial [Kuettlingeria erythrocarpa]